MKYLMCFLLPFIVLGVLFVHGSWKLKKEWIKKGILDKNGNHIPSDYSIYD